uniref:DISC1 scaffold protein n=2 Tax=Bos TaxID=9903 RepID=A0AAA9TD50_BOVIN
MLGGGPQGAPAGGGRGHRAAEMIQQRLEALEKERSSLHFQLPSQQPALSALLGHLGAQAQASLRWAAQRAGGDDPQARLRMDPKTLEAAAQDSLRVSITRRDWLLREKQQLQKEIETLQARMSVLEAKDQQLRREIEEQERLLPWQGCDLVGGLSLGELQEVTKTLQDTLALAEQIPLHAEPPETIRRKPFLYSQGAHRGDQIINTGEGSAGGTSSQAVGTEFQERPKAGKCERRLQQTQARTGPGESCL